MSHTPHELAEEFPEHHEKMQKLKQGNTHFGRLVDEYHAINRAIHRAETNIEPVAEQHETELRHQRVRLKDTIFAILSAA